MSRPHSSPASGLRWLIYLRQSQQKHDAEGAISFNSFELQERACRDAIARVDHRAASITVIKDHNRSGGAGKRRPGRDRMFDVITSGAANAVMAFRVTRLGRDLYESVLLWRQLAEECGAYIAASDQLDLSDVVVRGVLFAMAEKENAERADWSRGVIDLRRSKGLPPVKTGRAFGHRWDGDRLVTDPDEWPIVLQVFQWFDSGISMNAIARSLSAARAKRRNTSHTQWDAATVSRILRCTWHIGRVPDGASFWNCGQNFLGDVDSELWERVQGKLRGRKATGQNFDRALSGLLYCGICSGWSPMSLCYARHRRKDGSIQQTDRYRCIHHVRDRAYCPGQSISAPAIERFLLAQLNAVVSGDELGEARFARRQRLAAEQEDVKADEQTEQIAALRAKRDLLSNRLAEAKFEIDPEWFNAQMRSIAQEIEVHEERRQRAAGRASLSRASLARLRQELMGDQPFTEERWFGLPPGRRNDFLRLLFPDGLLIGPPTSGSPPGDITGRVSPRQPEVDEPSPHATIDQREHERSADHA